MIVNKLELLWKRIDGLDSAFSQPPIAKDKLLGLNEEMQELLKQVSAEGDILAGSLLARQAMLEWTWPADGVPAEAVKMYMADQLSFYRALLTEMMALFTGNERGRCVSFNLTVEELLFMIRLLLEEKIMNTQALKPIFLFLSRYASTIGGEALSYESLRKKYSRSNPLARGKVKQVLGKMDSRIDHINKSE